MGTKIRCQVNAFAKHYWIPLRSDKQDDSKSKKAKKFVKRRLLCGSGSRRLRTSQFPKGELVEVGDIIEIDDLSELGNAIDKFTILNPQDVETEEKKSEKKEEKIREKKGLKTVKIEKGRGFDVINQDTGLAINDEPLTKKEADAIVKDSKKDD